MRPPDDLQLGERFWDCLHFYWWCKQVTQGMGVGAIDASRIVVHGGTKRIGSPRDYITDFQRLAKGLRGTNRDFFEAYFEPSSSKLDLRALEVRVRNTLRITRKEFPQREEKVAQALGAIVEGRHLWPAKQYSIRRQERVGAL